MTGDEWRQSAEDCWNDAWESARGKDRAEYLEAAKVSGLIAVAYELGRIADALEKGVTP